MHQTLAAIAYGALMRLIFLQPTIMSALRGSPYLTRMRLDWLEIHLERPMPLTVQLLGSTDDLVSPEDNIHSATGSDFRYLDIPRSGHVTVTDMGFAEDRIQSSGARRSKPGGMSTSKRSVRLPNS